MEIGNHICGLPAASVDMAPLIEAIPGGLEFHQMLCKLVCGQRGGPAIRRARVGGTCPNAPHCVKEVEATLVFTVSLASTIRRRRSA